MNDVLTIILAVLGFVGWEVTRRGWRRAARETANARDLAEKLNAEFGRRLLAEERVHRLTGYITGLEGRLATIAAVATRRPPRRRWLAIVHHVARLAGAP